jgi:hypothetical protein
MRARTIGQLTGLAVALTAPAAQAAAPIMPLSDVQAGMKCTGYSVFHGQQIETFDVDIIDIVGESSNFAQDPKLMIQVSGDKVKDTGIGPGFSGSPILCPSPSDGTPENAGAISYGIGEYGNDVALATPIEQILATPLDAPTAAQERAARRGMSPRDRAILRDARPLAAPVSFGGLNPSLMKGLSAAAARRNGVVFAAPSVPSDSSPVVPFEPGSAVATGFSSGDIKIAAIGTVSYVDGDGIWAFGHPLDGIGARDLILQDAYVATVINNPVGADGLTTYKFSGPIHDRGTLSDDGFNGVAGRTGDLPPLIGVDVVSHDNDRGLESTLHVDVADETDVGNPSGIAALSWIAPIAISEGPSDILGSAPQMLAGRMCLTITVRERPRPASFCNRYVNDGVASGSVGSNPVALSAGLDASTALSYFDTYKGKPVHITSAKATVTQSRVQRQAYLRSVTLPKKVHRGELVPATIVARVVRGDRKTFHTLWKVPRKFEPGKHKIRLRGSDPDSGFGFFDEIIIDLFGDEDSFFDSEGPRTLSQLIRLFKSTHHWDGIRLKSGQRFYRDDTYRIGGRARTKVRVLKG